MTYALTCDKDISTLADGAPTCTGKWILVQLPDVFDVTKLDPVMLSKAMGAGFVLIASFCLIGLTLKLAIKPLKDRYFGP